MFSNSDFSVHSERLFLAEGNARGHENMGTSDTFRYIVGYQPLKSNTRTRSQCDLFRSINSK